MDPNQLQRQKIFTDSERTPLIFQYSHHLEAVRRLRSLICISAVINALLVITILTLIIYAIIAVNINVNGNVTEKPVIIMTSSQAPISPSSSLWPEPSESPQGVFSKASVAADNGICSEIGRNVLIRGGNAVDAAISAQFCTGVMDPQSSGLGGGHFMTIYNSSLKICEIIDARETAPNATNERTYANDTYNSEIGYTSIAVPGELAGLWTAYKYYGSGNILWADLILPTIELCENGFPVSGALAEHLSSNEDFILNEISLHIFINPNTNKTYDLGDIMRSSTLAKTLRKLAFALDPVQMFYNSNMTIDIVNEMQNAGGFITEEDFYNYQVKFGNENRPPVTMPLQKGLTMCGPPPPSSASVVGAVLNVLNGFNISWENLSTTDSNVDFYHKFIESMKFAQSVRQHLGDIDFDPNSLDIAENITSALYGEYVKLKILPTAQSESYYEIDGQPLRDYGTSHVSVVDEMGNAVSLTSSINWPFGAKVRSESTGIIWNNEMGDFSQPWQKSSNLVAPGKRPMSSMSPVVVYDSESGRVKLVTGGCGGSRIVSVVAQILLRILYLNQTVKEAVDSPRLFPNVHPLVTEFESRFPSPYVDGLRARDQRMTKVNDGTSSTAIYRSENGKLFANTDYRKPGGYPSGY